MPRTAVTLAALCLLCAICLAESPVVEVLYVASPQGSQNASLLTYNVDPNIAVAERVGHAVTIPSTSVTPLTIEGRHLIYVWNSTDVWMYRTNSKGVPERRPSQHLSFDFPAPVLTFLADPTESSHTLDLNGQMQMAITPP